MFFKIKVSRDFMGEAISKVMPLIIFIGLIIGAVVIFFIFSFLSANFWLLLIAAIIIIPIL